MTGTCFDTTIVDYGPYPQQQESCCKTTIVDYGLYPQGQQILPKKPPLWIMGPIHNGENPALRPPL